ncbi:Phosphatidylinositide phosphatase SAC1 [Mitosporidium daphniae]
MLAREICDFQYHINCENAATYLSISRITGEISLSNSFQRSIPESFDKQFFGILGMIDLELGPYLVVISNVSFVCSLPYDRHIFEVLDVDVLPCYAKPLKCDASLMQSFQEKEYIYLVKCFFLKNKVYFCKSYDLTNSSQSTYATDEPPGPLGSHIKTQFCSNFYLLQRLLLGNKLSMDQLKPFVVIAIEGCRASANLLCFRHWMLSRAFLWPIIQYNSNLPEELESIRGIDKDGFVSNFCETEQILLTSNNLVSFLQIRGSMPIFWSQVPSGKYSPTIDVAPLEYSRAAFVKHFTEISNQYGNVQSVNLVHSHGVENVPASIYASLFEQSLFPMQNAKFSYLHFDLHKESSKDLNSLQNLLASVEDFVDSSGAFQLCLADNRIISLQSGIIRTNCIDCLDRTNVAQCLFGTYILTKQLKNILGADFSNPQFNSKLSNLWADNADGLSVHYSGTGALKTEITRYGKRTILGRFSDLKRSVHRYYLNNFKDGPRQDAMDLVYGRLIPTPNGLRKAPPRMIKVLKLDSYFSDTGAAINSFHCFCVRAFA